MCMQKESLEPMQRSVEGVNRAGQVLVQSAPAGVSTSALETDLDRLNDKWAQLNNMVCRVNVISDVVDMSV